MKGLLFLLIAILIGLAVYHKFFHKKVAGGTETETK